ncbi:MAG: hypothetical protein FJ293_14825, partial [Planctomycetes bacterium]|nr:hypothetical protein [Planctomycetota bacterium]
MSPAVRGGVVVVLCLPLLPGCDARAPEPSPAPPPATAHARDPALDPPLVAPIRGDAAAARVHHAAGLRVLADGDVAAARTAFERALAVDPAGVDARIDLGFLLLEGVARGGFGAALEQFRLASLLVPDDPRAACGEGIVRVELGDFERAGPLLERAIAAPALLAFPGRVAAAQA